MTHSFIRNIFNFKQGFKDTLALLFSNIGSQIISLIRGLYVARILGPADFGLLSSLLLINKLNKFGDLGFNAVVSREVPYLEGKGEFEKIRLTKNNAYSSEIIFAIGLLIIGVITSVLIEDKRIMIAIILASLGLFFGKIAKISSTEIIVEKNFINLAQVHLFIQIVVSIFVISTVHILGIFSSLIFTVVGSILTIIIFQYLIEYKYTFNINKKEFFRQLKLGIPLTLTTLFYGTYRYSERLLILSFLGTFSLGLYAIATRVMDTILGLFQIRGKILKIQVSQKLGAGEYADAHKILVRNTIFPILAAIAILPFLWALIDYGFPLFLGEKYIEAIGIVKLLSIASVVRLLGTFTPIVLVSPLVNKQKILPIFDFISTIFLISVTFILYYINHLNLETIVYADITGYLISHVSLVILYYKYFYFKYVS